MKTITNWNWAKLGILLLLVCVVALSVGGRRQDPTKSIKVVAKTGPLQGVTAYTDSYALFVGISDYENTRIRSLPSADNDAKSVRDALVQKFGFNPDPGHTKILLGKQATRQNIERELARLSDTRRVKKSDRVLVYFSMHGQQVPTPNGEGVGYLIPFDATVDLDDVSNPSEYQASCIKMSDVADRLNQSPAVHRALIVDACFSGFSFERKGFADGQSIPPEALKSMLSKRGLAIMTAGTSEDEALASNSRTGLSPFTRAFIESLDKAEIGGGTFVLGEMASEVKSRTISFTKGKQNPQYGVQDGIGELILFPTTPQNPPITDTGIITKLPTSADLAISVTPADAKIEVDGRTVSASSSFELEPGGKKKVTVRVSSPGFEPERFEVELSAGKTVPITVTLKAVPKTSLGIGSTKLSTRGNVEMMYVPEGTFTMGSMASDDEKPVRRVYLDSYWISKNVVTVAEFRAYCNITGYKFDWNAYKPTWGWVDSHPIVNLSWDEARAFCRWAGGDLPTEAQWEKAARGEVDREFPWGSTYDPTKLWASKSSAGDAKGTAPVGSFTSGASAYGCLDMAGNVWQWCLDYYGDYDASSINNPVGPGSGQYRVLRGGGWYEDLPDQFRCANRNAYFPYRRHEYYGFRVAARG